MRFLIIEFSGKFLQNALVTVYSTKSFEMSKRNYLNTYKFNDKCSQNLFINSHLLYSGLSKRFLFIGDYI